MTQKTNESLNELRDDIYEDEWIGFNNSYIN